MSQDHCDLLCLDLPKAEELRSTRLGVGEAETLAAEAKALGDPVRLTTALALRDGGELCVCDLSWIVERSQALVSHHMRSAGLVRSRRDGKMVMYSLTPRGSELLRSLLRAPAGVTA